MYKKLLACCQLLRLPNLFSAWADILLGYWLVHPVESTIWPDLLLLLIASSGLYLSGMAWNDIFDLEVDRRERSRRPLVSGSVSLTFAVVLASALMAGGVGAAAASSSNAAWLALVLVGLILTYNGGAKHTLAGPVVMGLCRCANVYLGMTPGLDLNSFLMAWPWEMSTQTFLAILIPWANGFYILAVTTYARQEVAITARSGLTLATFLLLLSLIVHGSILASWPTTTSVPRPAAWLLALTGAMILAKPVMRVWTNPDPVTVQQVVVTCLRGLVWLNAMQLTAVRGPLVGVAVLFLLLPAYWLGRRLYST